MWNNELVDESKELLAEITAPLNLNNVVRSSESNNLQRLK